MNFQLLSKKEAVEILAKIAGNSLPLIVEVSEDICFKDKQNNYKWIELGKIELKRDSSKFQTAIQYGTYEWYTPSREDLDSRIKEALQSDDGVNDKKHLIERIQKALHQGFQDIIRRLLLLLPTFDSHAICKMPLRRPTTIVPDTTAIQQGAIDFVARFLYPKARIKIPAVVYMEIENQINNYMQIRQDKTNRKKNAQALERHLLGLGGQRTLLRLELHSEAEVDRGNLGADPIRGIIQPDSDEEDKSLGLTCVTRSFADRLIVETARNRRAELRHDHPLILLTSDQGMARMAMAEGMDVFYFQARNTPEIFNKIITGTLFHPFDNKLYTVSLADVLWELAVSFGGARITDYQGDFYLELWSLGGPDQLIWQPLHAKDDLIWGQYQLPSSISNQITLDVETPKTTTNKFAPKGYKFAAEKMLYFISILADKDTLTHSDIDDILKVKTSDTSYHYIKFLQSGQFVTEEKDRIVINDNLRELWQAFKELDILEIHRLLMNVPSYSGFCSSIHKNRRLAADSELTQINKFYLRSYIAMGEMAGMILSTHDENIVATDADPNVTDFASYALKCYNEISRKSNEELILTGEWLECLADQFAIHPIKARLLLNKAKDEGIVNFSLEGSTPDTRFPKHNMTMLILEEGKPVLKKVFLYQGDFISPGTAGVRIKITGKSNAI